MAKEFDIYLNKRVTECDIIVYSIPYRDGLTVINRLILECCLESYALQKFIAIQTGSELTSHIDEMLKICRERLSFGLRLDASVDFQTHYALYSDMSAIQIGAEDLSVLETSFAAAESALCLSAAPILAFVGKSLGTGSSAIEFNSYVTNTLKRSILTAHMPVCIDASIAETNKQAFLQAESTIIPMATLTNLCYRVNLAIETAIQISASVIDTEFHYSLGKAESQIEFGAAIPEDYVTKFEAFNNSLHILSSVVESIIQFMEPDNGEVIVDADVSAILKRHRLLNEMDGDSLRVYDEMTLEEIYYVIV